VREINVEGKSVALMRSQALLVRLYGTRVLPDSINAALKLATNLVADIDDFHFFGESPVPSGFELAPVVIRWMDPAVGLRTGFTWPLPDWQGFLSTTLFVETWNEVVSSRSWSEAETPEISYLARLFLTLVINLAKNRNNENPTQVQSWVQLADKLYSLCPGEGATERDRRIRTWVLGRAGLLAAPESGLPAAEANLWLASLKNSFGSTWNDSDIPARLFAERRSQIRKRWEGEEPHRDKVTEILQAIDNQSSLFHWVNEIPTALSYSAIEVLRTAMVRTAEPTEQKA
jgi:hypothetical protein